MQGMHADLKGHDGSVVNTGKADLSEWKNINDIKVSGNHIIGVIKINLSKPAKSGKVLSVSKIVKAVIPASNYKVTQGETVFAIGNPTGGLPGWLCSGIVASLENSIPVSDIGNMKLMGISAPTNPGNSGGGLFNMYGELIGITNAGNTTMQLTLQFPCILQIKTLTAKLTTA